MSSLRPLPQVSNYTQLKPFISDFLSEMKTSLAPDIFLKKLKVIGVQSRTTFFALVHRRRMVSARQLEQIIRAFDFSNSESRRLQTMKILGAAPAASINEKVLVSPEVLSTPLTTILLNICALPGAMTRQQVQQLGFASHTEISAAVDLLLKENLIAEQDGVLRRIEFRTLCTFPGVKSDHSRKYLGRSLDMAKENYALDLSEREYVVFSTALDQKNMGVLKDLIRKFREDVYALKNQGTADSVIHINLNAFTVYKN